MSFDQPYYTSFYVPNDQTEEVNKFLIDEFPENQFSENFYITSQSGYKKTLVGVRTSAEDIVTLFRLKYGCT